MSIPPKNIPEDAKQIFDGIIYKIYQYERPNFDGTTGKFESLARLDSTMIIPILQNNKLLITKQEQPHRDKPFLSFPGGRLEQREQPLEGAKRELLEETGYQSKDINLWKKHNPNTSMDYNFFIYIAKNLKQIQNPTPDSGEKIEVLEQTLDEILEEIEDPIWRVGDYMRFELTRIKYSKKHRNNFEKLIFN